MTPFVILDLYSMKWKIKIKRSHVERAFWIGLSVLVIFSMLIAPFLY
jgi:hypothetical protein